MDNNSVILINQDARTLDELFLNEQFTLHKLYDRIYSISCGKNTLDWIVKTYTGKKFAHKESKNLYKLKNTPNIPQILTAGFTEKLNYIIISKAHGKDLFDFLIPPNTSYSNFFSEKRTKHIAKQLLTIIKNIHEKHVIHYDIKPENIIYNKHTKLITLIDFEERDTPGYRSPEQAKHSKKITNKTDIWSAGLTIYFLASGERLFENDYDTLNKKIKMKDNWSLDFKDFLYCLLERNVDLRYNAKEALEHIWFFD